eukprot:gnl/Trimastix_PCT/4896.p1 GENE.gnl/Trimastix_PCT/4896~~gnl/Trimastix_PCT/4896.p1  ORF type:complete len:139 (-),score=0.53 gnl/Trimastix_PCT/4896:63-479(-)
MPRRKPRCKLSLEFLLKSLLDKHVHVELRDGKQITGILDEVDDQMNLIMLKAKYHFPPCTDHIPTQELVICYVSGRTIRYVFIPKTMDCPNSINQQRIREMRVEKQNRRPTLRHSKARQARDEMQRVKDRARTKIKQA